jgi:plasmid stability protein
MAKTKNDTKRVGCVLPGELHHRLKVYTATHKVKMGDWIRTAIHRTLAKAEVSK